MSQNLPAVAPNQNRSDEEAPRASSTKRSPTTPAKKRNPRKAKRGRVLVMSTRMFRARPQSLGSTTTAYEADEDDATDPHQIPLVGDSHHRGLVSTRLPELHESHSWRKSVEARLARKYEDLSEMPKAQERPDATQQDVGLPAAQPPMVDVRSSIGSDDTQQNSENEVESATAKPGLCGISLGSSLSRIQSRRRAERGAEKRLLDGAPHTRDAADLEPKIDANGYGNEMRVPMPRRVRNKLAKRYLKAFTHDVRKRRSQILLVGHHSPKAIEQRKDGFSDEGTESCQTKQVANQSSTISILALERRGVEAPTDITQTRSPITRNRSIQEEQRDSGKEALNVATNDHVSRRAQNAQIALPLGDKSTLNMSAVDVQKILVSQSLQRPNSRGSGPSTAGTRCLPFYQVNDSISSSRQNSAFHSSACFPPVQASNSRSQAAGSNWKSKNSSLMSSTGMPLYGPHQTQSTDALRLIEARAQGRYTMTSSHKSPILDAYAMNIRENQRINKPPERPLPEIPSDLEPPWENRKQSESRTSVCFRGYSRIPVSLAFHQIKPTSTSSGMTLRTADGAESRPRSPQDHLMWQPKINQDQSGFGAQTGGIATSKILAIQAISPTTNPEATPELRSPTSISSQESALTGPLYARSTTGYSTARADRVRALKRRDIASAKRSDHNQYPHYRRFSEERRETLESTNQIDSFPSFTPPKSASPSRTKNRNHSRQHSVSQSHTSPNYKHSPTYSASRHAQVKRLTRQILTQSNIMVWADTNPITAMFRAGAISPNQSITSVSRSPRRPGVRTKERDSPRSVRNSVFIAAPQAMSYSQRSGTFPTPPSSANGVTGDMDRVRRERTAAGLDRRQGLAVVPSPKRRLFVASSTTLEKLNISSEIEKVDSYMLYLESDREILKRKIAKLESMLAMSLRREYWIDTRANGAENDGNVRRWRGIGMSKRHSRQFPSVSSVLGGSVSQTSPLRLISDPHRVSKAPSASTETSVETETSTGSSNTNGLSFNNVAGGRVEVSRPSAALSMTSIENADGTVPGLR